MLGLLILQVGNLPLAATQATVPIPDGWRPDDAVHRFGPDRLWEYINGTDALFLDYGCQELLVQDIVRGDLAVTISLYDHGTALNAFGIFQRERGAGGENLADVGAAAVLQPPYRGLLLKDRFYAKLETAGGDLDRAELAELLADLARQLPGADTLPPQLSLLPAEHQIKDSIAFTRRDYLGLAELRDCVHAAYREPARGLEYQVFVLRTDERFLDSLGQRWRMQDENGTRLLWREIPYRGLVVMRGGAEYLIGVAGLSDRNMAVALLDALNPGTYSR